MQTLYKRKSGSNDDNIIPLINVVFLLLIFFMVAGKISPNHAAVDLPVSQSESPVIEVAIIIQIDTRGLIFLNAIPVLQENLATELQKVLQVATGESKVSIAVEADSNLEARKLTPVMDIIRAAGVEKIRLFTRTGDAT